jgi:hypothetical protein
VTSRLLLPVLVVLLAVLAVAGCGGSDQISKADFQDLVVNTRDRVDFALSRTTKAESLDEFLNRMDEASVAIESAANDLGDVTPPEKYAKPTDRLVGALHQLSVDISDTSSDIRNGAFGDLTGSGIQGLNFPSWDQANAALSELARLGLKVELIQRH